MSGSDRKTPDKQDARLTTGYLAQRVGGGVGQALWTGIADAVREKDVNLVCFIGDRLHDPQGASLPGNVIYDLMDTGIREQKAKAVILDITGVPIVDSGVAAYLNKTVQAARTIVTGISEAVAETIVDLGIDWSGIETLRDLRIGLQAALAAMGLCVGGKAGN